MIRHFASTVRQAGLSLIEMMVGLAIGLFLTVGLFTLISNTSSSFKVQDDFARMQDNAATAFRYLGASLRQAGFLGYLQDLTQVVPAYGGLTVGNDCGSATNLPATNWSLDTTFPIFGFTGLTQIDVNTVLPCITATNFLDIPAPNQQQILVTRGANGFRIPDPNNDGNLSDGIAQQRNNGANTLYIQADPAQGVFFLGGAYAAMRGAGANRTMTTPAIRDADIFEYSAHVYYIRPCSRFGSGTSCKPVGALVVDDDDGRPIPTLVRQEFSEGGMVEVGLAEGIERMMIMYGIDNNTDGVVDAYTKTPAAGDWKNIVAVRVALLVRSATITPQYDDGAKKYDLDGDNVADFWCTQVVATQTNPAPCNYKRKVFTQLFQLRNVAQRRGL